jgi:predicted Zn-dependent protease
MAFLKASSLAPEFVAPQLNLGLLALARGEAPAAVTAFDAVLARDPQNRRARVARGQAYLALKQFAKASEDLEGAVLQNPDDAAAWKWLAYAREATGAKTAKEAWCEAKKHGDALAAKHCP